MGGWCKSKNIPLIQAAITEKEKLIFDNLKEKDADEETFWGSKGWFMRFKSQNTAMLYNYVAKQQAQDVASFPKRF